jgi:hypothetical protein
MTMAQTSAEIAEELKLFGLSGLDDLIEATLDDCRRQPGKRNRDPNCRLAEFLHDCLTDVRCAAERFIAVAATQEAEAQRIAEEADRQYEQTWGAFVASVTGPKAMA